VSDGEAKPPEAIRVLVADDHVVVRLGIVTLINRQPDMRVVAEASSGQEVVSLWKQHHPDVSLLDLRMPGMGGVEATEAIRALDPRARIMVLTIHKGDDAVYRALRAGAQGYLLKDVRSKDLVAGIRSVHEGQPCLPPEITARMLKRIRHADLTEREVSCIKLVAKGLSNRQIAEHLNVSEATAKGDVASVLSKLGAQDRTHAVTVALARNIIDLDDLRSSPTSG
jgi:two-component system, NarL family, response regulator